jgi:hypothetical protein
MKNKHQSHIASKLLLQTRRPYSPLYINAKHASIKENRQTYTDFSRA